jgi:flagellar biosynthetic protein FlhB
MSETEDKSQQTEEPSQRKLEKARERGEVFTSKELNSFLSIFTLSLCIVILGGLFSISLLEKLKKFITSPYQILATLNKNGGNPSSDDIIGIMGNLIMDVAPFIILPAFIMMVVNIVSMLSQHGIIYSPEVIQPQLSRISPLAGFKRIFSLNSVMEFLKGILKISIVGSIAYITIKSELKSFSYAYELPIISGMKLLMKVLIKLFVGICCFMFALAVIDYLYQRYAYMNKMKMSKKEVKDEHKQQEGSPQVKSKLRAMRAKMSRSRIMAVMPKADVLITNPTHYAIALEYKPETMETPIMIAKGQDNIALMMRGMAKEHKIPIVENPPLARLLYKDLEIGMEIKEIHYKAVADVISYIMQLQNKKLKK